jgi:quercetin dioxygenase-like cupin family protein
MKIWWSGIGLGLTVASAFLTRTLLVAGPAGSPQDRTPSRSRIALSHRLPRLNGDQLDATIVEVTYEPGGANAAHRHPCPVIGYVLEGGLRMQVKGQPETIYTAGETFYEAPTDVHLVSANASQEKPARFLAYFVCDHPTPFSIPVTDAREN